MQRQRHTTPRQSRRHVNADATSTPTQRRRHVNVNVTSTPTQRQRHVNRGRLHETRAPY